jgi:hypothetical protein
MARRHHATMKKLDDLRDRFAGVTGRFVGTIETATGAWFGGTIEGGDRSPADQPRRRHRPDRSRSPRLRWRSVERRPEQPRQRLRRQLLRGHGVRLRQALEGDRQDARRRRPSVGATVRGRLVPGRSGSPDSVTCADPEILTAPRQRAVGTSRESDRGFATKSRLENGTQRRS